MDLSLLLPSEDDPYMESVTTEHLTFLRLHKMCDDLMRHIRDEKEIPCLCKEPFTDNQRQAVEWMETEKSRYTGQAIKLFYNYEARDTDLFMYVIQVVNTQARTTLFRAQSVIDTDETKDYKTLKIDLAAAWDTAWDATYNAHDNTQEGPVNSQKEEK